MPRSRVWCAIFVACAFLAGCESKKPTYPPKTETENLIYVAATSHDNRDIIVLNDWLRANPDRRIVSMTGIIAGEGGGVRGYIIRFDRGDNSRQQCTKIFSKPGTFWGTNDGFGIQALDAWILEHRAFKNLLITAIPFGGKGSHAYTLCFDGE